MGSPRRECLDHTILLHERHLKRVLTEYFHYYHRWRTHQALEMDSPENPLIDWEFLRRCTVGFDESNMPAGADPKKNFKDYLLGTYTGKPTTLPPITYEIYMLIRRRDAGGDYPFGDIGVIDPSWINR